MEESPNILLNLKLRKLKKDDTFYTSVFNNYFNLVPYDRGLFKNEKIKKNMINDILDKMLDNINLLHVQYLNKLHSMNKIKKHQFSMFRVAFTISINNYFMLSFAEKNILRQKYEYIENLILSKERKCSIA